MNYKPKKICQAVACPCTQSMHTLSCPHKMDLVQVHSISELNNSTSLRSVRERKRPGAKTSRGPAFIFGNKAGAEPKNDIELRFVLSILKSDTDERRTPVSVEF